MSQSFAITNSLSTIMCIICEPESALFELAPNDKAMIVLHPPFAADELEFIYSLYENKFSISIWSKTATYSLYINEVEVF
jgi:hypothetical protein